MKIFSTFSVIAFACAFAGQTYLLGVTHGRHFADDEIAQLTRADAHLRGSCAELQKTADSCVEKLNHASQSMELAAKQLRADVATMNVCRQYAETHP